MPSQVEPLLTKRKDREVLQLKSKVGKPGLKIVVVDTTRESREVIIATSRARIDPSATKDLLDKDQAHQKSLARILTVMNRGEEVMIVAVVDSRAARIVIVADLQPTHSLFVGIHAFFQQDRSL